MNECLLAGCVWWLASVSYFSRGWWWVSEKGSIQEWEGPNISHHSTAILGPVCPRTGTDSCGVARGEINMWTVRKTLGFPENSLGVWMNLLAGKYWDKASGTHHHRQWGMWVYWDRAEGVSDCIFRWMFSFCCLLMNQGVFYEAKLMQVLLFLQWPHCPGNEMS